jgi:hypothetical protein
MMPHKAPVITDPYRPSVGLTSSDDTPLVVKSDDELPSGMKPHESESSLSPMTQNESVRCSVAQTHI